MVSGTSDSKSTPDLPDAAFIASFEDCTHPLADWTHRSHIRMAWIYLSRYSFEEALGRIRTGLLQYAAAHGVPDAIDRGYHETLTVVWLRLVHVTMRHQPQAVDLTAFCLEQPHLLARTLLNLYYTRDRKTTADAKARFIAPDIAPLPNL
jgi:hypothetical protein